MKKIIILSLCLALILNVSGCSKPKPMEVDPPVQSETGENTVAQEGDVVKFPEFKTVDIEGKEVTNEFFLENDLTVVNLWATF